MASPVKQVFISYAEEDANFAQRLADDLKRLGARVWIAPDSIHPSEPWLDAIERGLRESSHVAIVLTPAALEASGAKMERDMAITLALQDRIKVISLLLKRCEVPLVLSRYQMILTFEEDYEAGLSQLADHLGLQVELSEAGKEEEKPQPPGRWLSRLPLLALAALVVLVIGVVVFESGLISGGKEPTHAPVLEPQPGPKSTSEPEATDTPVPEMTDTPVPSADTPTREPRTPPSNASLYDTWTRPADGMEMVYVPGGTFLMGSTADELDAALEQCKSDREPGKCEPGKFDNESPSHSVTLDGFWLDQTEVTNAQYARCVTDGSCDPPSRSSSERYDSYYGNSPYDDYPVIWVDWFDADAYCKWAGGRLPTEAEWEYAARGPDRSIYPWGDDPPNATLLNYNWIVGDTVQVGSYPEGASWVGAMDMAGNVWEWVYDRHAEDYYAESPERNPAGPPTGYDNALRGGSFSRDPVNVRTAQRAYNPPNFDYWNIGFRCVVAFTSFYDTWTRPADGMEMVYVPGGTFEMGSTDTEIDAAFEQCEQDRGSGVCQRLFFERESPPHSVTLDAFWIDKTEVTNDQFERFVRDTDYRTDAEKTGTGWVYSGGSWNEVDGADWQHPNGRESSISDRTDHPVVQVSWNDASAYCQWAGGRLPTEAEWEYGARGPDGIKYPWGDTFDGNRLNWCDANCTFEWKDESYDDGYEQTAPVGSYPVGASWVGAMDMAGNVWEWVADWYDPDYYASSPSQDPPGPETGDLQVRRGGSWRQYEVWVRAAARAGPHPGGLSADFGFRCVVEPGN